MYIVKITTGFEIDNVDYRAGAEVSVTKKIFDKMDKDSYVIVSIPSEKKKATAVKGDKQTLDA